MKSLKRVLVLGEKNIFAELSQIISIAAEANTKLLSMLGKCKNQECLDSILAEIRLLEQKSDSVAFKASGDITSGVVSPSIVESFLEAVRISDDIVDNYYYVSRELNRMYHTRFPYSEAPEDLEWTAIFKSQLDLADKALVKVKAILASSDLDEIRQLREEIEELEHQGDEIKDRGFDRLYHEATNMYYIQFYHYSEMLHKIDDIQDGCEDLSDLVLSVINSILK
ncbi:MAG: DUF47 domain-containing protein [Candidatus Bathyarchaeia archaeon]